MFKANRYQFECMSSNCLLNEFKDIKRDADVIRVSLKKNYRVFTKGLIDELTYRNNNENINVIIILDVYSEQAINANLYYALIGQGYDFIVNVVGYEFYAKESVVVESDIAVSILLFCFVSILSMIAMNGFSYIPISIICMIVVGSYIRKKHKRLRAALRSDKHILVKGYGKSQLVV